MGQVFRESPIEDVYGCYCPLFHSSRATSTDTPASRRTPTRERALTEKTLELRDVAASERLGAWLAERLERGHLLELRGDLGVGKTTLARAIITARLAYDQRSEMIPSPTFSLIQTYETRSLILTHADLYRIDEPLALQELDLEGALEVGALVVEWPRFLENLVAPNRLEVSLSFASEPDKHPETRLITLRGSGVWAEHLKGALSDTEAFLL